MSVSTSRRKPFIDGYTLADGRIINVLADGRLVNIVAGNGHPADIMDLSFAIQTMGALYLAKHGKTLNAGLYNIPDEIDREIALMKARSLGLQLDVLTDEQEAYLSSTG